MKPIFFSVKWQTPASEIAMDYFRAIERNMKVESLSKYTDCLDRIEIMPDCKGRDYLRLYPDDERKYVGWKRREAILRLYIDFESFVYDSEEEWMRQCADLVRRALEIVSDKCKGKKLRFDLNLLLEDVFPPH